MSLLSSVTGFGSSPFGSKTKQGMLFMNSDETTEASPQDVEAFILENSLDNIASEKLRSISPRDQGAVIGMGPATGTNPSKVVMSRINRCSTGIQGAWSAHTSLSTLPGQVGRMSGLGFNQWKELGSPNLEEMVNAFIMENEVDE